MKNRILWLKIIAPAMLGCVCILIINMVRGNWLNIYPLVFGLIIGFFNIEQNRFKPVLGIILSVFAAYISYLLGIGAFLFLGYTMRAVGISIDDGISPLFIWSMTFCIIPSLALYFLYKYLLDFPKSKKTLQIFIVSISVLLISYYLILIIKYSILASGHYMNMPQISMIFWQVIMITGIQAIVYQKTG